MTRVIAPDGALAENAFLSRNVKTPAWLMLMVSTAVLAMGGRSQFAAAATWIGGCSKISTNAWSATASAPALKSQASRGGSATDLLGRAVPFVHAPRGGGWLTVRDVPMSQLPFRLNYERDNGSGMFYYGPDDIARVTLRRDAMDEPASPPTALRTTIPAGWTGGGGSMSRWEMRGFPPNNGELYVGYTLRPSANWWHPADDVGWKNFYLRPVGGDANSIHFLAWVDHANNGPGVMLPKFGTQWGGKATDEVWTNAEFSKRIRAGQWNTIEMLITPNSDGKYNGSVQLWINGISLPLSNPAHGGGINWFLAGQPIGWDGIWWDMIYANPASIPPQDQYVDHGHVLIKVKTYVGTGSPAGQI